jgi:hypothetical protein
MEAATFISAALPKRTKTNIFAGEALRILAKGYNDLKTLYLMEFVWLHHKNLSLCSL